MKHTTARPRASHFAAVSLAANLLAIAPAILVSPSAADEDATYAPKTTANGRRIYLSAAWHTADPGARGECKNKIERIMSRQLAYRIADYSYVDPALPGDVNRALSGLTERGYRVRVGRGSPAENSSRSNAWGADAHVPLHSNAIGTSPLYPSGARCEGQDSGPGARGTWQIYNPGDGQGLPNRLVTQLDGVTPGRNDQVCKIEDCTQYSCLEELCSIDAPSASYSETEFHDWNRGVELMVDDRAAVSVKIATAIDNHFGG